MWDVFDEMWNNRNYGKHHTKTVDVQTKCTQLKEKIQQQFNIGYSSLNADNYSLLNITIKDLLKTDFDYQR